MARAYEYITKFTSPNQNARKSKVKSITIHHWGSRGQKFDNVVNWLCQKRAGTSAHYVVEAGKVACIVDPDRRAWHAGSSKGNHESIGIECRPEATDGDYETVAALIADLRAVYGDLPLRPHRYWTSTACPGVWDLDRLDRLARGKTAGVSGGGKGAASKTPPVSTKPQASTASKLTVDGVFGAASAKALQARLGVTADGKIGSDTIKAWQRHEGTPVDGVISGQVTAIDAAFPAIKDSQIKRGGGGSNLLRAVQRNLNVKPVDGYGGHDLAKAMQHAINTNPNAFKKKG